jgi:heme exporter protein B
LSSSWRVEISAIYRKELQTELRTRSGILTTGMFSLVSVVAISFAALQERLSPSVAASLLWVTLLFSSVISLPRAFIAEEEGGTSNLLRLMARPHAIYWGKALFNLLQMSLTALAITLLFALLANLQLGHWEVYFLALAGGCTSLSGAVTLCGALVAQASNRSALAAAIGVPLLLPLVILGVGAMRICFGAGGYDAGLTSALGLVVYSLAIFAAGPWLFAAVWKQ